MIPRRLEIEGFLAYKNKVSLDFSLLQYAVIVGENGAGKSSLLDAILFALYGKAREVEKVDELINERSEKASVIFEFSTGEDIYQVVREKERNGDSRIYFYKYDTTFRVFKATGHRGVKANEEAIIKVVGLDYDAFTSSVLLIQGKSDKFLSVRPSERKNVLTKILGLNIYENIRLKASEYFRLIKNELISINNDLSVLTGINEDLIEEIQVALERKNIEINDTKNIIEQIRLNLNYLREKERVEKELKGDILKLESYNLILKSKEEIIQKYLLYQDSLKISPHLLIINNLEKDISRLEKSLTEETENLKYFTENIVSIKEKIQILESNYQKQDREVKSLRDRFSQIEGTIKKLKQDEYKLQQRLDTLKGKDVCPLCGTELTSKNQDHLQQELSDINLELSGLLTEKEQIIKRLTTEESILKKLLTELNEMKQDYTSQEVRIKSLEKNIKKINSDLEEKIVSINREREILLVEKSKGNRAIELTPIEIESILKQKEIVSLYQEVLIADQQRLDLQERIEKLNTSNRELEKQITLLSNHSFDLKLVEDLFFNKNNYLQMLEKEKEILVRKLAISEEQLKNKLRLTARKKELDKKENIYSFITKAFSSENIQTLVVKKALYDIEHHSNDLLKMLSNGRLSLDFDTTSSLDKLDITIKDSFTQEKRKYNLLSGGEKFRTALSIALGIGRYVSSTSNKNIQCMFIDEGFSSLDTVGRESLIEVIKSLKNEIKLILIITHLEDIAEAFPVQIKVKKDRYSYLTVSAKV